MRGLQPSSALGWSLHQRAGSTGRFPMAHLQSQLGPGSSGRVNGGSYTICETVGGNQSGEDVHPCPTPEQFCGLVVKNPPANAGDAGCIPGLGDPLKAGMATHSSVPPWKIQWTREPGGLQPIRSQRVQHNLSDLALNAHKQF